MVREGSVISRIMRALLFILAAAAAFAQPAGQKLPANWYGAGASYAAPQVAGWVSYAGLVSRPQQLYSYTTHDITRVASPGPARLQSSTRTGFAAVVRTLGPLIILGYGDGGTALAGDHGGGAFSGGGIGILRLGRTCWTIAAAVRSLKTSIGGSQTVVAVGIGRISE